MSFIWRSSVTNTTPSDISDTGLLAIRIALTVVLGIGLLYGFLILRTFRRYGVVMDKAWQKRIDEWIPVQGRFFRETPESTFIQPAVDNPPQSHQNPSMHSGHPPVPSYSRGAYWSPSNASGPSALNKSPAATASNSAVLAPHPFAQPKYPGGYVPQAARTPSPVAATPQQQQQRYQQPQTQPQTQTQAIATTTAAPVAAAASGSAIAENGNIVTRVRALHTFEAIEIGELAFEKGDIIKVIDQGYKDWWRGQLQGRTGIFPVNYVVCFSFVSDRRI